jgi:K+-transporting ATPase KdpF subunit
LPLRSFTGSPARRCETNMLFDYILGGLVTVVIMVYLVYALINPERF